MTDKTDLAAWYNYAYAFVKDTKVSWSVDTSKSSVQTTFAVTTEAKQGSQSSTLLALMPHQWKNSATLTPRSQNFSTLRGIMKVISGTGFTVTNKFQGIVPFLPDRGDYDKTHVQSLLTADAAMTFAQQGTYWHGKELNKLANLIPLAGQMGEDQSADSLAAKLETDLINWFTYTPGENYGYFYYDRTWGSLIGYTPEYGLENFTDQHFHFGYFVNASSLLSLYDKNFATAYGPMVELLIRSYASPFRDDALFPFLRTFDPYEGHSWADGHGTTDSGNNQESSAEAMNSWAAIYLWGLSTGNATYRDLGIWGYTTEYSAIKEYYFDIDHSQYAGGYNHNVVGILWGGKADYGTWFGTLPTQPEDVHGIQILPLNASMLYQGYDTAYALANYNQMVAENGGTETTWQDTFWKFQSLFDPAAALAKYNESIDYDSANSKTSTYHWLHDFNVLGTVDTSIYADCSSYAVFTKAGQKTFVCFNPSATGLAVKFYRFSDNGLAGTLQAPPHAMVSTTDFTTLTVERLAQFASGGAGQGLSLYYATESWNVTVAVPQGSFSGTVNMSVTRITPPAGDGTTMRVVPVGFQVVLDREVQPSRDITITVNYTDNDIAGFDEQRLVLGRYDEGQQLWVPLSSVVSPGSNQVIGRTSHLSRFALLELAAAQDLNGLRVYPNPYRPGSGTGYDRAGGIVFSHLTAQARIRIYTVAGELVFEGETDDGTGNFEWKAVNACGQKVASGVYVYVVTAPSGEIKKGKIAIEK
jgi:hypothetical protein